MNAPARLLMSSVLVATFLAGCVSDTPTPTLPVVPPINPNLHIPINLTNVMTFTESIVKPAVGVAADLYEPTMEVSDTGVIYVAAHVIGAATTGTPAFFSKDDGKTWAPLPFAGPAFCPSPCQGSAPPPGDEGYIVAGDNGRAYMADINLAMFPVDAWCDNGASLCYHNANAYDRSESSTTCNPTSLNDRPWAAYSNGKLLLVNNDGAGTVQIGILDVPDLPSGGPAKWNMCAREGGAIPGIPGIRKDGLFGVPQMAGNAVHVVVGNAKDVMTVKDKVAFKATGGPQAGGWPVVAFDADQTMWVVASNNTNVGAGEEKELRAGVRIATSTDGMTYVNRSFLLPTGPIGYFFFDASIKGPGGIISWSAPDPEGSNDQLWYVAHVLPNATGVPMVSNVSFVGLSRGAYGHILNSAVGPDGRAYVVTFHNEGSYPGSNPLRVWVQSKDTPKLPVK